MCQMLWLIVVAVATGTCVPRVQCQFNNASSGIHEWMPQDHTHLRTQGKAYLNFTAKTATWDQKVE
jgi:hypothetical protein